MTFDEVSSGTRRLAAALRSRFGVADGRTVALALPNCIEYPLTALAVNLAQGTAALVNPAHTLGNHRRDTLEWNSILIVQAIVINLDKLINFSM